MNTTPTQTTPPSAGSVFSRWLAAGTMGSILSTVVLAWYGRRRHGSSTALINSPSHWVHGDRALRANAFSLRFTLLGALIHHVSSMFWAVLYEGALTAWRKRRAEQGAAPQQPSTAQVIATASVLSTVAWLVDTRLVPRRLTPGFERRSSSKGMLLIYGAFATGLAAGALMLQRQHTAKAPADGQAPRRLKAVGSAGSA